MSEPTATGDMLALKAAWYALCSSIWLALGKEHMAWSMKRKARLCTEELERLR